MTLKKAVISVIIILTALITAAVLSVLNSSAMLTKQHGGVPDSKRTYEYYSFEGQSSAIYQNILSINYHSNQDIASNAYMCLLIDNELTVMPDTYLNTNFSEYEVECSIEENNNKNLILHFTGTGVSGENDREDIDFNVKVDWKKVMRSDSESVILEVL